MDWPSLSPSPYLEESFGWMIVTCISPWDMSIMSVQIQYKSSLNQGLTDKLKGLNSMEGGGKNGPDAVS